MSCINVNSCFKSLTTSWIWSATKQIKSHGGAQTTHANKYPCYTSSLYDKVQLQQALILCCLSQSLRLVWFSNRESRVLNFVSVRFSFFLFCSCNKNGFGLCCCCVRELSGFWWAIMVLTASRLDTDQYYHTSSLYRMSDESQHHSAHSLMSDDRTQSAEYTNEKIARRETKANLIQGLTKLELKIISST